MEENSSVLTLAIPVPTNTLAQNRRCHSPKSLKFFSQFEESSSSDDWEEMEDDVLSSPKPRFRGISRRPSNEEVADKILNWSDTTSLRKSCEELNRVNIKESVHEIWDVQTNNPDWHIRTRAAIQIGLLHSEGSPSNKIEQDSEKALEYFHKADNDNHPRGSFKIGEILYGRGDEEDAISYFSRSIELFCGSTSDEEFFSSFDFQYMLNDYRRGCLMIPKFFDIIKIYEDNKFLKKIVGWRESRS
eukprot:TRINITY_DN3428_c0_g2_i1.p1 TRINITY_DN3428_c0_g2~~TRINITY_DN3428_c0_g2_i1.p1  ORF type:complete len:262 (-),score=55.57 TRINITY_DN3428_c0_g2_i1:137-871(-)